MRRHTFSAVVLVIGLISGSTLGQGSWIRPLSPGASTSFDGITVTNTSQSGEIQVSKSTTSGTVKYKVSIGAGKKAKVALAGDPEASQIPGNVILHLDMEGTGANPSTCRVTGCGKKQNSADIPIEVDGVSGQNDSVVDGTTHTGQDPAEPGATDVTWSGDHSKVSLDGATILF